MTTGLDVFDTTVEKTNKILIAIEEELGWQGRRNQSYAALRVILHAIRDRLRVDDAVNFSSQLPLLLKGVFFEEWKPESVPLKMDKEDFVQYVACQFPFNLEGGVHRLIQVVAGQVISSMDPGEASKLLTVLPEEIAELISPR